MDIKGGGAWITVGRGEFCGDDCSLSDSLSELSLLLWEAGLLVYELLGNNMAVEDEVEATSPF